MIKYHHLLIILIIFQSNNHLSWLFICYNEVTRGLYMKYQQRRDVILHLLENKEDLSFQEIESTIDASPATLRRDLERMENNKLIQRYHGGIRKIQTVTSETPIKERHNVNLLEKRRIAEKAASLIQPNELIFIDSGSTTLSMIDFITDTSITVITNGILQAQKFKEKNINCFLLCGFMSMRSNAVMGKETVRLLKSFRYDKAFLGANAIDMKLGILAPDDNECELKTAIFECAKETYVLADNSKFGKKSMFALQDADTTSVKVITDKPFLDFTCYDLIITEVK